MVLRVLHDLVQGSLRIALVSHCRSPIKSLELTNPENLECCCHGSLPRHNEFGGPQGWRGDSAGARGEQNSERLGDS